MSSPFAGLVLHSVLTAKVRAARSSSSSSSSSSSLVQVINIK